jgi:hypothetical protein
MPADEVSEQLDSPPAPSEMRGAARRVLSGTVVKYASLAINIGTGIFLLPFTIDHLGKEIYGLWMIVASMTAYFHLFDGGFRHSLVRHIAEADAQRDANRINELASTFVVIFGGIGLAVLGGTATVALGVLPRYPKIDPTHLATAQAVMLILGARVALALPMSVFGAVSTSRQAFARNGITAIAVTLLQTFATVQVLSRGYGLVPLVATTTLIGVLSYVVYAHTAFSVLPSLRINPMKYFRSERVRELASFGVYVFFINIAVQVGFNLDNLVVGAWLGTAAVAVYAVSFRLASYQRQLCNQFNGLLFPVLVRFGALGNTACGVCAGGWCHVDDAARRRRAASRVGRAGLRERCGAAVRAGDHGHCARLAATSRQHVDGHGPASPRRRGLHRRVRRQPRAQHPAGAALRHDWRRPRHDDSGDGGESRVVDAGGLPRAFGPVRPIPVRGHAARVDSADRHGRRWADAHGMVGGRSARERAAASGRHRRDVQHYFPRGAAPHDPRTLRHCFARSLAVRPRRARLDE